MNLRSLGRSQAEPIQARALRIVVCDGRRYVAGREEAGEVRGDRRLTNAALRVDHQRRVHAHGRLMLQCTRRLPGIEPYECGFATKAARARSIIAKRAHGACEADHNAAVPRASRFGRFTKCKVRWRRREGCRGRRGSRASAARRLARGESAPLEQRERLDVMRVRKHIEHAHRAQPKPVMLDEHLRVARERSRVT